MLSKLKSLFIKYQIHVEIKKEKEKVKKKKNLIQKATLTDEQIASVDKLWLDNYGETIPKDWHRLYTSYTGIFNEKYFPEIYFTTNLIMKLNPTKIKKIISDKVLTQYFFNDIDDEKYKIVNNYFYNCSGYFYDKNGLITYEDLLDKISNIKEVIIKPSIDSNSGRNVALFNIQNGIDIYSKKSIEEILKKYNKNYLVQEKIKPHPAYAKLNSSSINTIRMHSYVCEGKVYVTPIVIRIGREGSIVDNAHAGGIAVGVMEDGTLMKYGFFENGEKFDKHPDSKVVFENYKLPKIPEMINFIKEYHHRIPHIGIIAWDLTVDSENKVVIVETNIECPGIWLPQYCTGQAFFGDNTEKMIRLLKDDK